MSFKLAKEKIYKVYGDSLVLCEKGYVNTRTKACFYDKEHGKFWAWFYDILRNKSCHPKRIKEKIKKTYLKKYGVDHSSKDAFVALKTARNSNNSYILIHWKTNEELVCQASYEKAYVEHRNKNKINFEWQPEVFVMPNGRTYRPDSYEPDTDKWIEIKGYMRKDAQAKWDWFHGEHPNSELWDKAKLKEMRIL